MFVTYEVLLYLVFFLGLPFFLLAGLVRGKYVANFTERMGVYRTPSRGHDLWLHAVSVGEAIAARPVVAEIARLRPGTSLVVTTTTITGQVQARRLYPEATVAYFPFDFSFAVRRFLGHHRPRVFATMETEIWPNATRLARARGLRLVMANGRISDRSFPRYRLLRFAVRRILGHYDRILAREDTDRTRFIAIGAPASIVETTGNVKFDYEPDAAPLAIAPELERMIAGRRVLVLGSTMEGEDEAFVPLLSAFIAAENAFVIVAPRKQERFEAVAVLLAGLDFARRSVILSREDGEGSGAKLPDASEALRSAQGDNSILLLDTFGELAKIYRFADAAFVGGSIAKFGGHNPIEPAAAGVPVCFGPSMTNFRDVASTFLGAHAAVEVRDAGEVLAFARRMFADDAARHALGEKARSTVLANRGAAARTARRIVELLA